MTPQTWNAYYNPPGNEVFCSTYHTNQSRLSSPQVFFRRPLSSLGERILIISITWIWVPLEQLQATKSVTHLTKMADTIMKTAHWRTGGVRPQSKDLKSVKSVLWMNMLLSLSRYAVSLRAFISNSPPGSKWHRCTFERTIDGRGEHCW